MKKIALILLIAFVLSMTACAISPGSGDGSDSKTYTVKFDSNGGSAVDGIEVSKLEEAPKTEKAGYIFCGWFTDKDLTLPVSYPFNLTKNTTLYAKWANTTDSRTCADASVQFAYDDSYNYKAEYVVNPKNLDLEALAALGYYVKISVTYEVYYEKDFSLPIGYLGAPDHDVQLVDAYDQGVINENLATKTTATTESISLVASAESLVSKKFYLRFMTYNLQNIVHVQNINITYTCQPTAEN